MKRLVLAVGIFALAACNKPKAVAPPPQPAAPAPAPVAQVAPAPVAKPVPPPVDPASAQAVLSRLHAIDQAELTLAQSAKTDAKSKQVKSLAAELVKARTKLDGEVTAEAKKLNASLVDPSTLNLPAADKSDAQAVASELGAAQGKKGADFDAAFLTAVDDADKRESAMLTSVSTKAPAPELKSLETAQASALQKESKVAERDLKSVAPKKVASRKM